MGDHRDNPADHRCMNPAGFVPIENLVGFSITAAYPWHEVWRWPSEVRWSRPLRRIG